MLHLLKGNTSCAYTVHACTADPALLLQQHCSWIMRTPTIDGAEGLSAVNPAFDLRYGNNVMTLLLLLILLKGVQSSMGSKVS
jgi:hypothetical protein